MKCSRNKIQVLFTRIRMQDPEGFSKNLKNHWGYSTINGPQCQGLWTEQWPSSTPFILSQCCLWCACPDTGSADLPPPAEGAYESFGGTTWLQLSSKLSPKSVCVCVWGGWQCLSRSWQKDKRFRGVAEKAVVWLFVNLQVSCFENLISDVMVLRDECLICDCTMKANSLWI